MNKIILMKDIRRKKHRYCTRYVSFHGVKLRQRRSKLFILLLNLFSLRVKAKKNYSDLALGRISWRNREGETPLLLLNTCENTLVDEKPEAIDTYSIFCFGFSFNIVMACSTR